MNRKDLELRYQFGSARPRWVPRLGAALLVLVLLLSSAQFLSSGHIGVATPFWLLFCGAIILLPRLFPSEVVADTTGIRARPYINITWDQIDHVVQPSKFDEVVRVHLVDGREKVTGFAPQYAQRLADLGGKELKGI